MRIEALLKQSMQKYQKDIALIEWDCTAWETITYEILLKKALSFSQTLQEKKPSSGERIVLISRNQIESVIILFGIWFSNCTAILIDPDLPKEMIEKQIAIADARFFMIESDKYHEILAIKKTHHCLSFSKNAYQWESYNQNISSGFFNDCDSEIAVMMFTSGTTGESKAVMLTHQNFLYLTNHYRDQIAHFEKSCLLTVLPFFHIGGLFTALLQPLFYGGRVVFFRQFDSEAMKTAFQQYQPTILITIPKLLVLINEKIVKTVWLKNRFYIFLFQLSKKINFFLRKIVKINLGKFLFHKIHSQFGKNLTHIFTGSSALPKSTQKDFLSYGYDVFCSYGLTETCGPITFSNKKTQFTLGHVGNCVEKKDITIDASGEVIYSGNALMRGYFRDTMASEKFYTNDMGLLDANGNLIIYGRIKERIVLSDGKKAFPEEIEYFYKNIPGVKAFAVFSVVQNEEMKAVLGFVPENESDSLIIREKFFEKAAVLKSPYRVADVVSLANIPYSNTLKAKRYILSENYMSTAKNKKTDNIEENVSKYSELINCFYAVLSTNDKKITSKITFSELEIDSFSAVEITNKINEKYGLSLTPAVFWFSKNIAELYESIFYKEQKNKMMHNVKSKQYKKSDIAIIGVSCVFPGAKNFNEYWQNIIEGKDNIIEIPRSRWNNELYYDSYPLAPGKTNTNYGGFIDLPYDFSAEAFGIKKNVASLMDPQQKILLQQMKNLLSDCSFSSTELARTGLYLGAGTPEHLINAFQAQSPEKIMSYSGLAAADFSLISRLAYHFDIQGPTMLVNTACSSSLVAVHQAVRALQTEDCNIAIAGGINLLLTPYINVSLTKGGFLSPDGRCKSFDSTANGYVRSDGCGLVMLKRMEDALAAGDKILGVIVGSAVNQDGHSNGITAPNGKAQAACYQQALLDADVMPDVVRFIESHGTGTLLGDAIEMQSIQSVYDVPSNNKTYVGAVKSMIGHCEYAAGVAGLIKTMAVLQQQMVPRNLHYQQLNPAIAFTNDNIVLPIENKILFDSFDYGAVSAFGLAGTNVHMILKKFNH